jgi:hypothetical protein
VNVLHDIPMFILSCGISQRQVRLWWVTTPIAQYPCLNIKTMSHRIGHQTERGVDGSLELWFMEHAGTSKRAAEGKETGDMEAEAEDVMDGMWLFAMAF